MDDLIKRENEIIEDKSAEMNVFHDDKLIEIRKKKIINFLIQPKVWVTFFLIIAILLGIYIRTLPMQDHTRGPVSFSGFLLNPGKAFSGTPGLWDITTNSWTLGPDLDPWLFERYAKIIVENGSLPKVDYMRNVPLGFAIVDKTILLPYMIDWTYHVSGVFYDGTTVTFAAALFPVIMFVLTIIIFFFFVREIFIRKSKESKIKANIISLISTFFMIVMPVFLSRTIAGIPEKESAAFFFMFLSFYLFLKAWKSESIKTAVILGVLSGISTAAMSMIWGGVFYIYITIALASFFAFILNKIHKKELIVYLLWVLSFSSILILFTNARLIDFLISIRVSISFIVLFIFIIHFILWNTKISENKFLNKLKLPKTITSIIIALILLVIISTTLFGPNYVLGELKNIHQSTFRPVVGRWNTTVAENRQPFFTEWRGSFGPFYKGIPVFFWLFLAGSIILFRKMLDKIKSKDAWILTIAYTLLLFAMIFSRYSESSIFNGESFISKFVYYGAFVLFVFLAGKIYLNYYKKGDNSFEKIDYEYILLFILFILAVFSARGAVRLIMMLGPVVPIFVGFLIVELVGWFIKSEDTTYKLFFGALAIFVLILSIYSFYGIPGIGDGYYKQIRGDAFSFVPSAYNQQWQKAMSWVREETPKDAVFAHWWDYGYWVQSIGERATVGDGGNAVVFWNYFMGRLVLTGDNQHDALEFLYNHNVTHFLIDSSDIGKYGAFSQIGSDENYDRLSYIGTFLLDEGQTQETQNTTTHFYKGGIGLDEDLVIEQDGKEIFLPRGSAGVGAIIISYENSKDGVILKQPYVIMVYQGVQYNINLRYISVNGEFLDFKSGINATAFVYPTIYQQNQGINTNPIGAAMFISPRLMRGMLSQVYILGDPLNNFPNFKLVHTEQNLIIESLNSQGMELPDFVYFNGVQGPIKIWEIEYVGDEEFVQKYLDRDSSKYLSWSL